MAEAHHRSKQPEQVRAQLLKVAIELIVSEGYQSLTLDKVARRAGVSKGGLQYHFSSKAALLEDVYNMLGEKCDRKFEEALTQEPEDGLGRVTRAYIKTNFERLDPVHAKAICILTLAIPEFAQKYGDWLNSLIAEDQQKAPELAQMLLLCRFAADGFWMAETSGILRFDDAERISLLNRLLALTETIEEPIGSSVQSTQVPAAT